MTTHRARRNTNRAEGYDYAQAGCYFVTVCTQRLHPMFGEVMDGTMKLNAFGRIVAEEWFQIAATRSTIELDAFVVMPNHFHGVIVIHEADPFVRATPCVALGAQAPAASLDAACGRQTGPAGPRATHGVARTTVKHDPPAPSLRVIVGQVKSASSRRINALREMSGAPVWHRNYYDHIIRNEKDLDRIREYIANNPVNWAFDRANRKETTAA